MTTGLIRDLAAPLAALVVSALLTLAVQRHAGQRLLDLPGRRRSHAQPTPRGGGIGFVVALLAFGLLPRVSIDPFMTALLVAALVAVALIGFWDDHRPRPARLRLAVHVVAVALTLFALAPTLGFAPGTTLAGLATIAFGGALLWSINLHNFMDGIDGLLGLQALFVCVVAGVLAHIAGFADLRLLAIVGVAAIAGFLPFNFPRARVFMGDVGSGTLGLWLGVLLIMAIERGALSLSGALVLVSAFAIDATMTLLARIARGRRWYSAHREHLYQWLVRGGRSHARVAGLYMLWNFLIVVPATIAITRLSPASGWLLAAAVYTAGIALWWQGRRSCLARGRKRRWHDVAA